MFVFFITIHVITCILLILIVMIQQGKGGGLIESFSSAESIFGTKTNTFLVKATSVLAVIFFISCLAIAFLSIQRNKSLIKTSYKPPVSQSESGKNIPIAESPQKEEPKTTPSQVKNIESEKKISDEIKKIPGPSTKEEEKKEKNS